MAPVTIGLGIVGPGLVGGTLIRQLARQLPALRSDYNLTLTVLGVANSKKMLVAPAGVPLDSWSDALSGAAATPADLDAFASKLKAAVPAGGSACIVDCSASEAVAAQYESWLKAGLSVVVANKKANSGPFAYYSRLRQLSAASDASPPARYLYEATVGAGLPVLCTLKSLVATGDRVLAVEGIFSGTLSFIFNTWKRGQPFSEVVAEAKRLGYTEPDPRDDLSGLDVARKVIILAREAGLKMELSDVPVESLVPAALQGAATSEEYMRCLPDFDGEMAAKFAEADDAGEVLRFVGTVDTKAGTAVVGLRRFPKAHAFATLTGSDNVLSIRTAAYDKNPLIIRGPGAGAEVTAGGVFADIVRLAGNLSAPTC